MRSSKWLRIGCATFVALTIGVAYLARPVDELADVLRFPHRTIRVSYDGDSLPQTIYFFKAPPDQVLASIPGRKIPVTAFRGVEIQLPSGVRVAFSLASSMDLLQPHETCGLIMSTLPRTWYQRAWSTLKYRLGLIPN